MQKVLILCGGQSPEHPISIRSCRNVLNAIDRSIYEVTLVGISQTGTWLLLDQEAIGDTIVDQGQLIVIRPGADEPLLCDGKSLGHFDAVFPVLHGPNGEDGSIQGLLQLLNLPFVGPGVLGSSVCMDKDTSKRLLRDAKLNVAPWLLLRKGESIPPYATVAKDLGEVVFVKPSNMGSSVGVHRVTSSREWQEAVDDAFIYDNKVLVEQSILGRELECAILGNNLPKASGVGEVKSGDFYSFDEKYAGNSDAEVIIPADLSESDLQRLRSTAVKAYQALGCKGMSRVDMFLTKDGGIYVNEINTIPGFTSISMYPKLWEQEGIHYAELISQLIQLAIEER